jgi:hypothetical protein
MPTGAKPRVGQNRGHPELISLRGFHRFSQRDRRGVGVGLTESVARFAGSQRGKAARKGTAAPYMHHLLGQRLFTGNKSM